MPNTTSLPPLRYGSPAAAEGKKIAKELVGSSYVQNNQVIKGRRAK
ncbi:MAG: hypothetical protein MJE77_17770 [Proteobacteria bacterium]|nr:hypothetical protein [Pseudomonadota bacterium]